MSRKAYVYIVENAGDSPGRIYACFPTEALAFDYRDRVEAKIKQPCDIIKQELHFEIPENLPLA